MFLSAVFFPAVHTENFRVDACRASDGISAENPYRRQRGNASGSADAVGSAVCGSIRGREKIPAGTLNLFGYVRTGLMRKWEK